MIKTFKSICLPNLHNLLSVYRNKYAVTQQKAKLSTCKFYMLQINRYNTDVTLHSGAYQNFPMKLK